MYKTIVGPDGKVIEVSDINYPVVKADTYTTEEVIDMLKKLKAEIEEMDSREHECAFATPWCIDKDVVVEIIQEKINAL